MTVCKQRFPTKIIESRKDLWLDGSLPSFISGQDNCNFSCPQSPSSNSKETRSHMQPHPVAGSQPRGSGLSWTISQWRPEHRPTVAARFRIVCQPSLINSTFSVQGLELSRRLQCPGRPTKVLTLKKMAQLSQALPESKCASFSLFLLKLLRAGSSAMHHFFFSSAWQLKWQNGLYCPSSESLKAGTRELWGFCKKSDWSQVGGEENGSKLQSKPKPQSIWWALYC